MLAATLLISQESRAQWGAPYANSWIKYGKPYVKIGIAKKGLYRIPYSSLPKTFPIKSPEKLQLWRRGKQISMISASDKEIVFYAETNDGASDSLLYRPMSGRVNPYFSMYSDEGAYFLTVGDEPGARAKSITQPVDNKASLLTAHKEVAVTQFLESYSLSTVSAIKPALMNSYFESGASKSGPSIKADSLIFRNFKLENFAGNDQKSMFKLLLHGRSGNDRKIEVYIGKNKASLRLVKVLQSSGFNTQEHAFELKPEDLDANKNGVLALKSVSKERIERFSLTYFSIEFPQLIQLDNQFGKVFRLDPVKESWSRIAIKNASAKFAMLDISDANHPVVIHGSPANLMIPRKAKNHQILFATNAPIEVESSKLKKSNSKPSFQRSLTTSSLQRTACSVVRQSLLSIDRLLLAAVLSHSLQTLKTFIINSTMENPVQWQSRNSCVICLLRAGKTSIFS